MNYLLMQKDKLIKEKDFLNKSYEKLRGSSLNMARGKPASDQLDLSNELLSNINDDFIFSGFDIRNYGCLEGLPELKEV